MVAEDGGLGGLGREMEGSGKRVKVMESERERVLEVREDCGYEVRGWIVEFVKEKELAWREEKPWNVQEG